VADELAEKFGGVTAHTRAPPEGLWKERPQFRQEEVVVVTDGDKGELSLIAVVRRATAALNNVHAATPWRASAPARTPSVRHSSSRRRTPPAWRSTSLETLDGWQVTQPLPPRFAEVVKRVAANGPKEQATRRGGRRNG
jgi:hypothetical protein